MITQKPRSDKMKNYKQRSILSIPILSCFIAFSIKAKAFDTTSPGYMIKAATIKTTTQKRLIVQDTLTKKELLDRIKKVASKQFSVKAENIKLQTSFTKDFGADDLDMVELVMAFEEEFKIKIPDAQLETLTTVQKAYDYLIKKLKITK
jgi:acyl carrier protein